MSPAWKMPSAEASRRAFSPTVIVGAVSQMGPEPATEAVPARFRARVESTAPTTLVLKLPALRVIESPDSEAPALASQAPLTVIDEAPDTCSEATPANPAALNGATAAMTGWKLWKLPEPALVNVRKVPSRASARLVAR